MALNGATSSPIFVPTTAAFFPRAHSARTATRCGPTPISLCAGWDASWLTSWRATPRGLPRMERLIAEGPPSGPREAHSRREVEVWLTRQSAEPIRPHHTLTTRDLEAALH